MLVGEPARQNPCFQSCSQPQSLANPGLSCRDLQAQSKITCATAGTTRSCWRKGRANVPDAIAVLHAMRSGQIARIEELTRCPPRCKDAMISILSEKTIAIPELGQDLAVRARPGFNVIATSNLRDRGVHEMSSALKRRFNLRQCIPINDPLFERTLILSELHKRWKGMDLDLSVSSDVVDVLVTAFQDFAQAAPKMVSQSASRTLSCRRRKRSTWRMPLAWKRAIWIPGERHLLTSHARCRGSCSGRSRGWPEIPRLH